jgi:hypothetical protein
VTFSRAVGGAVLVILLLGYFTWVCIEMAGHTHDGGSTLIAIAVGVVAGALALLPGLLAGRRR